MSLFLLYNTNLAAHQSIDVAHGVYKPTQQTSSGPENGNAIARLGYVVLIFFRIKSVADFHT
jgi:hypothetical protein